jgi:hypothetical protein
MSVIVTLTLLSALGSCIVMFLVYSILDGLGYGIYAGVYTFGNVILPTVGAVVIYLMIKRWIKMKNPLYSVTLQAGSLLILYFMGVLIWAAGEAYLCGTLTAVGVKRVFISEFLGFLPVIFSHAVLIPLFGDWLTRANNYSSKKL